MFDRIAHTWSVPVLTYVLLFLNFFGILHIELLHWPQHFNKFFLKSLGVLLARIAQTVSSPKLILKLSSSASMDSTNSLGTSLIPYSSFPQQTILFSNMSNKSLDWFRTTQLLCGPDTKLVTSATPVSSACCTTLGILLCPCALSPKHFRIYFSSWLTSVMLYAHECASPVEMYLVPIQKSSGTSISR